MDVDARIKKMRKLHNMTTHKLSKHCGLSQSTISKLENGNRIPDIPTVKKICSVFNITLADFFAPERLPEPLNDNLFELYYVAKDLNDEQLESLLNFLKTFVDTGTGSLSTASSD